MKIRNLIAFLTSLCAALPVHAVVALCVCSGPAEVHAPECCCEGEHHGICEMEAAVPSLGSSTGPALGAPDTCTSQLAPAPSIVDAESVAAKAMAPPDVTPQSPPTSIDSSFAGSAPSPPTGSPPLFLLSCTLRC